MSCAELERSVGARHGNGRTTACCRGEQLVSCHDRGEDLVVGKWWAAVAGAMRRRSKAVRDLVEEATCTELTTLTIRSLSRGISTQQPRRHNSPWRCRSLPSTPS